MGRQVSNTNELRRKKNFYLILVWASLAIVVTAIILLYQFNASELIITIVEFLSVVYMVIVVFLSRSRVAYYDMNYRYAKLLENKAGVMLTSCEFDQSWLNKLNHEGFIKYLDDDRLSIYYRIRSSLTKRIIGKSNLLEMVTIVKNNDIDFYADLINDEYKKIWEYNQKQHRLNKQVIIQFKKYKSFNETIEQDLEKIICYKEGDNYLININCGYFSDKHQLYYLHADNYAPNLYYHHGAELIKSLTKK